MKAKEIEGDVNLCKFEQSIYTIKMLLIAIKGHILIVHLQYNHAMFKFTNT